MALVNYENVVEAAEALIAEGQKASVRKVIDRLGGGSPNAVLKLLGEFKSGRPVIRVADVDLDPAIIASIKRQMQAVAAEAAVAAEDRASSLSDDLQTLSEAQQVAEQQIAALSADKTRLEDAALELTAKLHDQELESAQKLQALQTKVDELAADLSKERDRANCAMQDLGKAQAKAEAVPTLEALIAKLQNELEAERSQRAAADQRAAVSDAQVKLVAEQASKLAADLAKAEQSHKDALAQLRQDLADARQATKEAQAELKSARAQIDALHEQAAAKAANSTSTDTKEQS